LGLEERIKRTHFWRIKHTGISDVRNAFFSSWPLTDRRSVSGKCRVKSPESPVQSTSVSCTPHFVELGISENKVRLRPFQGSFDQKKTLQNSKDMTQDIGDTAQKMNDITEQSGGGTN
jgi:hypothetical protein